MTDILEDVKRLVTLYGADDLYKAVKDVYRSIVDPIENRLSDEYSGYKGEMLVMYMSALLRKMDMDCIDYRKYPLSHPMLMK